MAPAESGWIRLFVQHPGQIRLTISLSSAIFDRGRSTCRPQPDQE
jgi:hypothetical protein